MHPVGTSLRPNLTSMCDLILNQFAPHQNQFVSPLIFVRFSFMFVRGNLSSSDEVGPHQDFIFMSNLWQTVWESSHFFFMNTKGNLMRMRRSLMIYSYPTRGQNKTGDKLIPSRGALFSLCSFVGSLCSASCFYVVSLLASSCSSLILV